MDTITSIECLESNGVITSDQAQAMKDSVSRLPTSDSALLSIIAAASLSGIGSGGGGGGSFSGAPIGNQDIAVSGASTLTPTAGATRAIITVFTNNIIFRLDSGTPTLTKGHFASQGSNFEVSNLAGFKCIPATGTANLFVSYY